MRTHAWSSLERTNGRRSAVALGLSTVMVAAGLTSVAVITAPSAQADPLFFSWPSTPRTAVPVCNDLEVGQITCGLYPGAVGWNHTLPAGVTSVTITATGTAGQAGGQGRAYTVIPCTQAGGVGGAGGRAGRVVTTVPATGGQTFAVTVAAATTQRSGGLGGWGQRLDNAASVFGCNASTDDAFGGNGGSGGSASFVTRDGAFVAVAAGGGGGGGGGASPSSPGAKGGDAEANGVTTTNAYNGLGGGSASTTGNGDTGGDDQLNSAVVAAGGGGGGGGGYRGGGGGQGGRDDGGGGGGGGSNYLPFGGMPSVVAASDQASVTITYVKPDRTAPIPQISISQSETGFLTLASASATATVSSTNDASGRTLRCVLLPQSSAAPASYDALPSGACGYLTSTAIPEGSWTVYAAARDSVGNTSGVTSKGVVVDATGPVITSTATTVAGSNGWLKGATLSYACSDPSSLAVRKTLVGYTASYTLKYEYGDDCPAAINLPDGATVEEPTVTSSDSLGNTSSYKGSAVRRIDGSDPFVALQGGPEHLGIYVVGEVPAPPTCTASDATSGLDGDCVVEGWSDAPGRHVIVVKARDNAGNERSYFLLYYVADGPPVDNTSPVIEASIVPGWRNAPVNLQWTVSDPESPFIIDSGCEAVTLNEETPLGDYGCAASNSLLASSSLIKLGLDMTAPTLTVVGGPADGAQYAVGEVPVEPTCDAVDALSGLYTCDVTGWSAERGSHTLTVVAWDNAGNDTTVTRTYSVKDVTPPVIQSFVSSEPTASGWLREATGVVFDVRDDESPYAVSGGCDPPAATQDGTTTLTCQAESEGGTSVATVEIKIDRAAPEIDFAGGPADQSLYYVGDVPVPTCDATDNASGVDSCTITGFSASAGEHTMTATAVDVAGNESSVSREYIVFTDYEGPEDVDFVGGPGAGASYYLGYVPPAPTCTGGDSESGFASCEVTGWSKDSGVHEMTATAYDRSGNASTRTRTYTVLADSSAPTIVRSLSPSRPANGWFSAPVSLSWTVTEAESPDSLETSGCAPLSVSSDTAHKTYTCSASSAGGSSSDPVTFGFDGTAPVLSPSVVSGVLAVGQIAPVVTPGATDALSGVESSSCLAVDTTSRGVRSALCQASDNAGNRATGSSRYAVSDAFLGYGRPLPKASVKAGSNITVKFRLGVFNGGTTRVTNATVRTVLASTATGAFTQATSVACPYNAVSGLYQCSLKTSSKGTLFIQTWQQVPVATGGTEWVLVANAATVLGKANANGESVVVR